MTENNNISPNNHASPSDDANNEAFDSGAPTANALERDSGNNKKLKVMAAILIGVLIMLVGLGVAVGRYSESREANKAEEAERIAQEQKRLSEGNSVNIAQDQEAIKLSQMYDLPVPDAAQDPSLIDPNSNLGTPTVIEPQPAIIAPVQPQYQTYENNPPYTGAPVQIPPQTSFSPVQEPQEAKTFFDADNNVMVDIYGKEAVAAQATNGQRSTTTTKNLEPSQLANGNADKRGDTSLLLIRGTTIPCVLKTRIDSTYQGFTSCQISKDVYSANGKTLLIERGSTVFGEQNVDLKQGQARVFVLWTRVETPKGISVDIDSPAAGQLGEMGIEAKVNNHFWKRFGGAIMLSLIKDASANASTRLANRDQANNVPTTANNSTSAAESMAEKALENTINIPPTATINQGKLIQIVVARDVNFGGIYELYRQ